jgi:hypothetical protein
MVGAKLHEPGAAMSTIGLLEQIARDVGWGGGLLYLVDQAGGALARWRQRNEFDRRMREADRTLPPELRGGPVPRPIDGGPAPLSSSRPAGAPPSEAWSPEQPTSGRGRPPR